MRAINKNKENRRVKIAVIIAFLLTVNSIFAQNVGINNTGATPSSSAVLDLSPNTNGGFLLPTVTSTQLSAITTAPNGTLIFNSTTNCMEVCYSNAWQNVICPCNAAPSTPGTISGSSSITSSSTGNTYSIAAVTGASSYTWTVPASVGTIVGSSTGTSITITAAGSAGSGTITVTASNNCGTSASSSLTVTVTSSCSGVISPDAYVAETEQYGSSSSFTITTTHANEVVLILANGLSDNGSYGGTITVTGGSASAITILKNSSANDGYFYTNSEMAGFIAATAATYTIHVPADNNDYDINNCAVSLYGFCSTATIAANVTAATATLVNGNNQSTVSNSITPTVANSYIVTNYYNWTWDGDYGTVTWSSPSGNALLLTDNNNNDYMDGEVDGYSQGAAAAVTFTVHDNDSYGANMYEVNLQSVDVHN